MRTSFRALFAFTACTSLLITWLVPSPVSAQPAPVSFVTGPWPSYASGAISVDPEPTDAGVPTEFCVHLYNSDTSPHAIAVEFFDAPLGIAPAFTPLVTSTGVVPALSEYEVCIAWAPPSIGPWSLQAKLMVFGYDDQYTVRSIDAIEPLEPLSPHPITFIVRNPLGTTQNISLGLIPHLSGWGFELNPDVFWNVPSGGERTCTLTTTPPADMPDSGTPITDIEAYIGGELIGGFRKMLPASYSCPGTRINLYADAARINTPSSSEERGAYVTAIHGFSLCAVGMEIDLQGPQAVVARIYEADGVTRGALLSWGVKVEALPGKRVHFVPVDCVLEACHDYDIAFQFGPVNGWDYFDEFTFAEPFDAGGIIRVRNGECAGDASNFVLPCLSLIGTPIDCPELTDVSSGGASWANCSDEPAERGIYVTARRTAAVCALGWEANFTSVPGEILGCIYEANGTTRGDLIASGSSAVTATGMQMHRIPLGAVLEEGRDYDFAVQFSPTTYACINESEITLPFEAGDVLTVRDGEMGGDPSNTIITHFSLEWSPAVGGTAFDLAKHGDEYPPPQSSTQSGIDHGIYVKSLVDQEAYSIGWKADVPAGAAIGARVYEAVGTTRGALLSEGYVVSSEAGMRWHDIPVAASLVANADYDFEIDIGTVNEWRWWSDGTGLPYESYGVIRVVDGECQGLATNLALIELRLRACGEALAGIDNAAGTPPRFRLGHVYPNPASTRFVVEYNLDAPSPVSIDVYDVSGRRVTTHRRSEQQPAGRGRAVLDLSALAPGAYFVRVNALGASVSRKIMIVR